MLRRYLAPLALCALVSCDKDDNKTLFKEVGTWSMSQFSLNGVGLSNVQGERQHGHQLQYDGEILAAAACQNEDELSRGIPGGVQSTDCMRGDDGPAGWFCECFVYEFSDNEMRWQSFEPNTDAPTELTGETEGDMAHALKVLPIQDRKRAFTYNSLPTNMWGSDGMTSLHVLEAVSDTLFPEECRTACFGEDPNAG